MAVKICTGAVSWLAALSLATSCLAQTGGGGRGRFPPNPAIPDCPSTNNSNNWRDYLQSCKRPWNYFSIYFDKMEGKSDVGWGELHKGQCLRANVHGGSETHAWGVPRSGGKVVGAQTPYTSDLSKNQINVWGHIFTVDNETGELFDEKLGLVGHLECSQTC